MADTFTYRSARSGSFVAGISAVLVIETVALHFALVGRHPVVAWALTIFNLLTIGWFVRDYQAMGRGVVSLDDRAAHLRIGRRVALEVPRAAIERVVQPTYKDLPTPGTNQGRDYANLTKPAQPNVLITLAEPMSLRLPGGIRRSARRIALHLDDPGAFIAALAGGGAAPGQTSNVQRQT